MDIKPPEICCRKTAFSPVADWAAVKAAFAGAEFAPFQQAWLPAAAADFRPARAAALWNDRELLVYGELTDDDIYNTVPEKEFNRLAINFGDMFEVFIQPEAQEAYFEIHVSPTNQKFQLRLPFPYAFRKLKDTVADGADLIERFKVWTPVLRSQVCVHPAPKQWQVLMAIPFSMVVENRQPLPGARWRFSFSRYDYTRPNKEPVYSSTSAHRVIDFHRIEEWGTLVFA